MTYFILFSDTMFFFQSGPHTSPLSVTCTMCICTS